MKLVLFELYYRSAYIFVAACFIECLTYFIEGPQLEYLSGLFTFSYQTVDFNFCEDTKLQVFLKQKQQMLFIIKSAHPSFYSFLTLSTNEAKAWFHLFIVYLSYFYCVELDKAILYNLLTYIKASHIVILIMMQVYGAVLPGLLKKSAPFFLFIGAYAVLAGVLFNQHLLLMLVSGVKELYLERLDSELI